MVSTTDWGRSPRTSVSHPETRNGVSRGPDAGAIESLSQKVLPQRNGPRRCCREEHQFWKPGPVGTVGRN